MLDNSRINSLVTVQEFYGLGPEFPLQTHLITRCLDAADRPKKCYYVSDAVRHILMMDETESLKVIAIGLKVRPAATLHHLECSFTNHKEHFAFFRPLWGCFVLYRSCSTINTRA